MGISYFAFAAYILQPLDPGAIFLFGPVPLVVLVAAKMYFVFIVKAKAGSYVKQQSLRQYKKQMSCEVFFLIISSGVLYLANLLLLSISWYFAKDSPIN